MVQCEVEKTKVRFISYIKGKLDLSVNSSSPGWENVTWAT